MFEKIVVVDSTGLNTWGVERLKELGKEVVFYTGIPETDSYYFYHVNSPLWSAEAARSPDQNLHLRLN